MPYMMKPLKTDPKVNMLNSFTVVYSQEEPLLALNEDRGNSVQTVVIQYSHHVKLECKTVKQERVKSKKLQAYQ